MPNYSFRCARCNHDWVESRKMAESSDPSGCPSCGHEGNHREIGPVRFKMDGDDSGRSDSYRLGKNMEKAKKLREDHRKVFGRYEEYVPKTGSRTVIDTERDVTVHGDIGTSSSEIEKAIKGDL
jgi:putative FmdB family regulatory protein